MVTGDDYKLPDKLCGSAKRPARASTSKCFNKNEIRLNFLSYSLIRYARVYQADTASE